MSSTNPEHPAFQQLTETNHGPAIIVSSYIFLVIAIITVFTRLITRFQITRKFHWDDWLIFLAIVFSLLQTVTLTIAVNHGLGRHREAISTSQFNVYSKAFYAARLLTVPALLFAKISTNLLIIGIHPPRKVRVTTIGVLALTVVWAVAILFLDAFQCSLPSPWNYESQQCLNQRSINIVGGVWNIVTDAALIVLPFFLMRKVQVAESKRWAVIGLFACRIIVPIFTIIGIVAAMPIYNSSLEDVTWYSTPSMIWLQAVISLSIITACIPCIKRFLEDLSTGMMAVNISEPLELTMKNASTSGRESTIEPKPSNGEGNSGNRRSVSRLFSRNDRTSQINPSDTATDVTEETKRPQTNSSTLSPSEKDSHFQKTAPSFQGGRNAMNTNYVERTVSVEGLNDNVILQTIGFEVNFENDSSEATAQDTNPTDTSSNSAGATGSVEQPSTKDLRSNGHMHS